MNSEQLPELQNSSETKHRMIKALENLHQYFSDDDAEISEETLDLLEELFGKLKWRDK